MIRRPRIRPASAGFTLLEVMIVLGLVSVLIAGAVRGFRSLTRSEVRAATAKIAGAMKYLFDRASTTGRIHRLVFDLDEGTYYAEVTDDKFYLPREKESDETRAKEAEAIAKEAEAKAREESNLGGGQQYDISKYMPTEWRPKRAKFQGFKETAVRKVTVKQAKVASVFTPRLAEPMSSGKAFVYFFPLGFTESAMIHVSDKKGEGFFTLVLHPLTGQVKVYDRWVDPPVERLYDDAGEEVPQ